MRVRLVPFASLLLLGACGGGGGGFVDGGSDMPRVDSASPEFGPLSGGTRVLVSGNGFLNAGAAPNHVLVNGVEATAAGIIDDNTIEVVIPAGDSPGDAEIVVYNSNGYASATGVFHYSSEPTIESMSPDEVRYDQGGMITITGSGFLDEDAGVNTVLIDGIPAVDIEVESDTELTFTALPGVVLNKPDVTIINRRGTAIGTGYKYGPGPAGGLIAFLRYNSGLPPATYAYFFDPITLELQPLPIKVAFGGGPTFPFFRGVFQDSTGQYLGVEHISNQIQMLDLDQQTASSGANLTYRLSEGVMVGTTFYALTKISQCNPNRFGTVDLSTGVFSQIGAAALGTCGGGTGLAADSGGVVYVYANNNLSTISRTTGVLGTLVPLSLPGNMVGMRFLGTTLYAVTNNNQIVTINTTTGAVEVVSSYNDGQTRFNSLATVQ